MPDILRERDMAAVFRFLSARGWSRAALAAATGLSETRVRGVVQGKQRIASYEVLERIADGLRIDRGLLGVAYTAAPAEAGARPGRADAGRRGLPGQLMTPERSASADVAVRQTAPARRDTARPATAGQDTDREAGTASHPSHAVGRPDPVDVRAHNLCCQLPPDIVDFTGRMDSVTELDRLLDARSAGNAVVVSSLCGKGGIGKTTLAVHVAHRVQARFPDGQLFVDLRGAEHQPADPSHVLGRFLAELGMESGSIPDHLEDRARLYRAQLAGRRVLVVLDNALDEKQVRMLLPGAPGCAVVMTSRRRLVGLAGAVHVPLEEMTAEQGLDLLSTVAGRERVAADTAAACDIVTLCGRLPLAIRIAGARLAARPRDRLDGFAERLRDERRRLDLLTAGDLEVRATFALSYEGCDAELRRAFRLLGLLETPSFAAWTLARLADIEPAQAEELVERLVDAELLETSASDVAGGRRYQFHDLLRVYAREQLLDIEPPQERRAAAERLLGEYARLGVGSAALVEHGGLEQLEPAMPASRAALQADPRGWMRTERAAFVGGTQLAFELELWDLAWRLAELVPVLFRWQSDWSDWEQTLATGLDAARRCPTPEGKARLRCSLGLLHRVQGQFTEAISELDASAATFTEIGDELRAAVAQRQLGDTYRYTGRLHDGLAAFTDALRVFEREHSTRMTAGTLNGLGDIYRGLSRWDESADAFRRSIALYEALDDELEVARATVRFGIVYRDRCLYGQAEELFTTGLSTLRRLGDRRWKARTLRHLGIVHRNTGRITTALQHFSGALAIFTELADPRGIAVTLRNIGDTHRYAGEIDIAEKFLRDALSRFRVLGDDRWQARTLISLADTIGHQSRWTNAAEHLQAATTIYDRISDAPGRARVLRSLGILHRAQQRWPDSLQAFERSQALFTTLGDEVWQARAIAGRARTQQARGDESWPELHDQAQQRCLAAGATTDAQVENWLHEW